MGSTPPPPLAAPAAAASLATASAAAASLATASAAAASLAAASAHPTDALPVHLNLRGPEALAVRRWVESVLGWQAVEGPPHRLVPAALALADVPGAGAVPAGLPLLLLVGQDPPLLAARAAIAARAVLSWPAERDQLAEAAARLSAPGDRVAAPPEIRVGGAAGGVGTTTVTLAIGGLAAWRGRRTLVTSGTAAGGDTTHGHLDRLTGVRGWEVASPVTGVAGLRTLSPPTTRGGETVGPGSADLVVTDAGVDLDVDVLVVRRDRAGLRGVATTAAGVVVVVELGPVETGALRAAAGGRRLVTLPWSARAGRAALASRVPAGLPGTWLRILATAVGDLIEDVTGARP